jgi:Domain of unknown function (DUF1905)
MSHITFTAPVWVYKGPAAWYFVTLPLDAAVEVRLAASVHKKRGWGSVRVEARIGGSVWRTSVFPEKESQSYLLPLKADVRRAEGLIEGSLAHVSLMLLDV